MDSGYNVKTARGKKVKLSPYYFDRKKSQDIYIKSSPQAGVTGPVHKI
jgi:hypothetical protein